MKRLGRGLLLAGATLSASAAGCGGGSSDGPEVAPVSGTVTVKGQPKAGLTVTFQPEGGGRPATGATDEDGEFTLTTFNTGDGAIVGAHRAAVSAAGGGDENAAPPMPGFPGHEEWAKKQREAIDPKYSDPKKSGLTYTVPSEGLPNVEIKIP